MPLTMEFVLPIQTVNGVKETIVVVDQVPYSEERRGLLNEGNRTKGLRTGDDGLLSLPFIQ